MCKLLQALSFLWAALFLANYLVQGGGKELYGSKIAFASASFFKFDV
jgi:hypothetical protein